MKIVFKFLKSYLKQYKVMFSIYLVLCLAYSAFSLISPYISGNFIDALLQMDRYEELVRYCIFFGVLSIGTILINFTVNRIFVCLKVKVGYQINKKILHHIRKIPMLEIQHETVAAISQKVNYDTGVVTSFALQTAQNILINAITLVIPLMALLKFNLKIGVILSGLIAVYLITYLGFKKPLFTCSQMARQKETAYFNQLYKQLSCVKFIKMNVIGPFFDILLGKSYGELFFSSMNMQKIGYVFASLDKIIMMIAQITLFIFGGMQVIDRKLTIGEFTIISTYFNMIMGAIRYFFGLGKTIQETQVSLNRLHELLNLQEEKYGDKRLYGIQSIKIDNMNYKVDQKTIIENFSYNFEKGKIYGVVGENGSGKSTLLNILTGMLFSLTESVYIDGLSVKDCDLNQIRQEKMGILEQEPILLEESIRDNLFLGGEDKSESKEFLELTELLALDIFFDKLPQGLETVINERAINISGGEKQKLSLLRVLIKNPDIIILDEPTSALDVESKEKLYSYLNKIKSNKIIIVVTHDDQIADKVDQIIRLPKPN